MKTTILFLILLIPLLTKSQNGNLQNLDINLSTVIYPFEVRYLNLHIQNQDLKLA